jgi:hypothetical protein
MLSAALASATTLDNLFLERAIRSEGHCPGTMPKHPHARRFSFVPASPVFRERFRTRCELSHTDAGSAPTVQRIKSKATQTGNPRLKSQGLCPFGHQGRISAQQAYSHLYAATRQTALCLERLSGPDKPRYGLRLRVLRQCGKRGLSGSR